MRIPSLLSSSCMQSFRLIPLSCPLDILIISGLNWTWNPKCRSVGVDWWGIVPLSSSSACIYGNEVWPSSLQGHITNSHTIPCSPGPPRPFPSPLTSHFPVCSGVEDCPVFPLGTFLQLFGHLSRCMVSNVPNIPPGWCYPRSCNFHMPGTLRHSASEMLLSMLRWIWILRGFQDEQASDAVCLFP